MARRFEGSGRRALALVLACTCVPRSLHAAPPDDIAAASEPASTPSTALEWYARGIELAEAKDFFGAAAAFLESHRLRPTPEALYNAALAYDNADDPIAAIELYRRYLAEPKATLEQKTAANAAIDRLLREVAVIKGLRYDPERPPVELRIAGEPHRLDEFPLPLLPGELDIEVVDAEGVIGRDSYSLAAGDSLVLDIRSLWPLPEPEPLPDPDPPPEVDTAPDPDTLARARRRARGLKLASFTGLGLVGAAGLGTVVAGSFAIHFQRRGNALACDGACDELSTARLDLIDKQHDAELATNVLLGVSAGLALATLGLGIAALQARKRVRTLEVRAALGGFALAF